MVLSCFGLKKGVDLEHSGLKLGIFFHSGLVLGILFTRNFFFFRINIGKLLALLKCLPYGGHYWVAAVTY